MKSNGQFKLSEEGLEPARREKKKENMIIRPDGRNSKAKRT